MDQNEPGPALCVVCGTPMRATDRYCPSCGAPNPAYRPPAGEQRPESAGPPPPSAEEPEAGFAPSAAPSWELPTPPQGNNRNTWLIVGAIFLFFLIVCCCCALVVAFTASQDSALQEELEGTAGFLLAVS